MNLDSTRKALHIPDSLGYWTDCNDNMNAIYQQQHNDTSDVFKAIFASNYTLRILIYNGDVDMACQFLGNFYVSKPNIAGTQRFSIDITNAYISLIEARLKTANSGDQWFIEKLAADVGMAAGQRQPWNYTQGSHLSRTGGYVKRFTLNNNQIVLDQMTVKGGGHFV